MGEGEQKHDVSANQKELDGTGGSEVVKKGKGKAKAVSISENTDLLEAPELLPDT
jgi:hypothetical protein